MGGGLNWRSWTMYIKKTPAMSTEGKITEHWTHGSLAEGEPVLSPKVVIGKDAEERLKNSARSVEEKRIIPVEVVCRRH